MEVPESAPQADLAPGPASVSSDAAAAGADSAPSKKPIACIVIGMAGSGKTTLMQVLGEFFMCIQL